MRRLGRPLAAAAAGAAVVAAQWIAVRPVFIDDSYIFYRYAENWADGLGPVFNRGEHVEGFTSFAWLGLLTLGEVAGVAPEDAGPALGLAAAVGTILVLAGAATRLFADRAPLALGVTLAAAVPIGVPYYAASGMDAPLFALALTAAAASVALWVERGTRPLVPGLLLALLVVVRAEGVVYAGAIVAVAALLVRPAPRSVAPLAAAVALAAVAVFAVRAAVYESLVPATVAAKGAATHHLTHGDVGELVEVIRAGLRYEGFAVLGLALAIGAGLFRVRRSPIPPLVLLGAAVVAVNLAISIWAGGDWMSHRRHLVPVLPLLALVAAWTAAANAAVLRGRGAAVAAGLVACLLTVTALGIEPSRLRDEPRGPEPEYLERIGRIAAATPGTALLTNVAGVLPYEAGVDTYTWDLLGLTDEHNARNGEDFVIAYGRTDYDYSFARDWDLLVTNNVGDAHALFDRLDDGAGLGPMRYLESSAWIDERLSVVVRPGHPIAHALTRECRCPAVALTPAARDRIRGRLGAP